MAAFVWVALIVAYAWSVWNLARIGRSPGPRSAAYPDAPRAGGSRIDLVTPEKERRDSA